ncbi:hypothetical protein TWF696_001361 [Orbilia brochopaga]|uniref:Uncharacterized protein n=1 Tax=Orbilia brochopaga TaxID=3140254 RepID=A0AAV9U8R4_9PEZI
MLSTMLLLPMALSLPAVVSADIYASNFTLVPAADKGIVIGTDILLDSTLQDACVEFAAIYYPNDMPDVPTTYQPPPAPPGYNVRLYQDPDCTKPVEEDEWPWEDDVTYDDEEEWVFGYYQLTSEYDTGAKEVVTPDDYVDLTTDGYVMDSDMDTVGVDAMEYDDTSAMYDTVEDGAVFYSPEYNPEYVASY